MKQIAAVLVFSALLSACAQTGRLGPGEIMGTDIGQVLMNEAGASTSTNAIEKANNEIDKALYFSPDGLTTSWYVGHDMRIRPLGDVQNRVDRTCRKVRHGQFLEGRWQNGTAVACREDNMAWYLISNRWDGQRNGERAGTPGNWDNLSGELGGATPHSKDQRW